MNVLLLSRTPRTICLLSLGLGLVVQSPAFAQDAPSAAVEQARLFQSTPAGVPTKMTADGMALPDSDGAVEDDSFGKQQILKAQEKVRDFVVSGDASVFYTNNVALTRRDMIADRFFVVNAGLAWSHAFGQTFQLQLGIRGSIFRYDATPQLDFNNFGGGATLAWAPRCPWGVVFVGRYDFTELLDTKGHELLTDHEWSLGAQKVFVFGRSHALSANLFGAAGLTTPEISQRDQVGGAIAYHLQFTRNFDTSIAYRWAFYFYNQGGRCDANQFLSLSISYHFPRYVTLTAFGSFGDNRSNRSVFDYDVLVGGGGAGLTIQF